MLKYIFAAVFAVLAWAAVLVFGLPLWPAIVATGVIVLVLIAAFLIGRLNAKRAASKIERGLEDQGKRHAKGGRPDRQHEIASMQDEFRKAVRALKTSKLGRGGGDALATLPWYAIVGPPGGGKTTALLNSGLRMPYQAKRGVRGVGGTRNCDWWLTNHAIILDTAGRWTTEDDDHDEWLAFLDLIKRSRPVKPLNGVLLAVAVDLLDPDEDKLNDLALKLRERLDEITQRLDVVLPVYLLVTKCDLLPGFNETFGDLREKERAQIWGVTLPLAAVPAERSEKLREHIVELENVIERRSLLRMTDERRLEARRAMYEFPQQFAALKGPLFALVDAMFPDNAFDDTAALRGVYFTSGTQMGQPIDRVVGRLAQGLGLSNVPGIAAPPPKPRSYFLRDVFMNVVFPDKDAAMMSSQALRKQRLTKIGVAVAAMMVSLGFLFLPFKAYLDNRQLISEAQGVVETLTSKAPLAPAALATLAGASKRMADLGVDGPGLFSRFGMYPGDTLLQPFQDAVQQQVIQRLLGDARDQLTALARRRSAVDPQLATSALTFYLLATDRKAQDEPTDSSKLWRDRWIPEVQRTATAIWAAAESGGQSSAEAKAALGEFVRLYAYLIPVLAKFQPRDVMLVSRAREALLGGRTGDPVEEMIGRATGLPKDIELIDVFGAAAANYRGGDKPDGGPKVRGAFTPDGWPILKKQIKAMMDEEEIDDLAWVLGPAAKRDRVDAGVLQSAYFRKYFEEWKTFFGDLQARSPTGLDDARALMQSVVRQKPLESLWSRAQENLVWKDDSPLNVLAGRGTSMLKNRITDIKKKILGEDAVAAEKKKADGRPRRAALRTPTADDPLKPEDLAGAFSAFLAFGTKEPSGVAMYAQAVNELLSTLEEGTPNVKQFRDTLKSQRLKLANYIVAFNESGWEGPVLERLLFPALTGAEVSVLGTNECAANRKWRESVVTAWEQMIEGKYPFAAKASKDAQVADVEKFFQPGAGVLWQYYTENLVADIAHPANTTTFQGKDDATVRYTAPLMAFLKRAQELTDFLFAKDKSKLSFVYSVRVKPAPAYSKIVFELGTTRLTVLTTRDRWQEAVFPSRVAYLNLQGKTNGQLGYADREWALFRLLDQGNPKPVHEVEDYILGTFTPPLSDTSLEIMFKPSQLSGMWRGLDLPRSIVGGAKGCGR